MRCCLTVSNGGGKADSYEGDLVHATENFHLSLSGAVEPTRPRDQLNGHALGHADLQERSSKPFWCSPH